jgi:hypothetical protein
MGDILLPLTILVMNLTEMGTQSRREEVVDSGNLLPERLESGNDLDLQPMLKIRTSVFKICSSCSKSASRFDGSNAKPRRPQAAKRDESVRELGHPDSASWRSLR